jgi:hypothetical protein
MLQQIVLLLIAENKTVNQVASSREIWKKRERNQK